MALKKPREAEPKKYFMNRQPNRITSAHIAQNRLLYVVFFCAAEHFVKLYPDKKYEKVKL